MGTVATGMAFGAGSEVAHQAIRGAMGGREDHSSSAQTENAQQSNYAQPSVNQCDLESNNFVECLKFNPGRIEACQPYADLLQQCQKQLK